MKAASTSGAASRHSASTQSSSTDYLDRFVDALGLLCTEPPPPALCAAWLDSDDEELQTWVVNHVRTGWASGIGTIEAAQVMADVPAEGEDHKGYLSETARAQSTSTRVFHLFGVTPERVARHEVPRLQYHDFMVKAASLDAARTEVLAHAGVADMAEVWGAEVGSAETVLVHPQRCFHVGETFEQHLHWWQNQEVYELLYTGPESIEAWHARPFDERAPQALDALEVPCASQAPNARGGYTSGAVAVVEQPSSADVEAGRRQAGLTQSQAAALVHGSLRGWQQWEAGDRRMHKAFWELFLLKAPTRAG